MDENLRLAKDVLCRYLIAHPERLDDPTYQVEWVRGFIAVCEAIDAGDDSSRVSSAYASRGFDDGRKEALATFSID